MHITTLGAGRTVTGSAHLVESAGKRVLLDFGLFQGPRLWARELNQNVPDAVKNVNAVVLSHGHLDHCGRLPMLAAAGYTGPIYATAATRDVAKVVLTDSADIQEEDALYLNRRTALGQQQPVKPLYTRKDVDRLMKLFVTTEYAKETHIAPELSVTLQDAGHILGSSSVLLRYLDSKCRKTLFFTGDVGRGGSPIIRDPVAPNSQSGPIDHIITECTYGSVLHKPMQEVEPAFIQYVKQTLQERGRVILPAFAVGRTQTLLYYLMRAFDRKQLPPVPVFVDSPMGVEMSQVTEKHRGLFDEDALSLVRGGRLFDPEFVRFCITPDESRAINHHQGGCIIIASSPTCEFGRVLHHLKRSLESPQDLVLFCGYTPGGTLGRRLQDGQTRLRVFDRFYDRKCRVATLHGLSAHADGTELLHYLSAAIGPTTTATVVHGEDDRADAFAARLVQAGAPTAVAPSHQTHTVFGQPWCDIGPMQVQADGQHHAVDE